MKIVTTKIARIIKNSRWIYLLCALCILCGHCCFAAGANRVDNPVFSGTATGSMKVNGTNDYSQGSLKLNGTNAGDAMTHPASDFVPAGTGTAAYSGTAAYATTSGSSAQSGTANNGPFGPFGSASSTSSTSYATASQGAKADTALQSGTTPIAGLLITVSGTAFTLSGTGALPLAQIPNLPGSQITSGTITIPIATSSFTLNGTSGATVFAEASTALQSSTSNTTGLLLSFTPGGQIVLSGSMVNYAVTSGSANSVAGANVSGTVAISATANQLGQVTVDASAIVGVALGTGTAMGSGTNNMTLINAFTAAKHAAGYSVHLIIPGNSWQEVPLSVAGGDWFEGRGNPLLKLSTNANCHNIVNTNQTYVNNSGSAGTITPIVSATAPLYGDTGIKVDGITFDGNSANQSTGLYGPLSDWVCNVWMSGVDGLIFENCTFQNSPRFNARIGNCRNSWFVRCNFIGGGATDDGAHFVGSCINFGTLFCRFAGHLDNCWTSNCGEDPNPANATKTTGTARWDQGNCYNGVMQGCSDDGDGIGTFTYITSSGTSDSENYYITIADNNFGPCFTRGSGNNDLWAFTGGDHFMTWRNNTVQNGAVSGYKQLALNPLDSSIRLESFHWPNYSFTIGGGGPFLLSNSGTYTSISIVGNDFIASTAATSSTAYPFVTINPGGTVVTGLNISDNIVNGFGHLCYNADTTVGVVNGVGGSGNVMINFAPGSQMYSGLGSNLWGQLATPLGDQLADVVMGGIEETTGTFDIAASVGVAANRDPLRNFIRWLHDNGLYQDLDGYVTMTQFNNQAQVPIGIGGLTLKHSVIGDGPITLGTAGYTGQWYFTTGLPAALSGTGPKTLVAVASVPNFSSFNSTAGIGLTSTTEICVDCPNGSTNQAGTKTPAGDLFVAKVGSQVTGSNVFYSVAYSSTDCTIAFISGTNSNSASVATAPPNISSSSTLRFGELGAGGIGVASTYSFIGYWDRKLTTAELSALQAEIKLTIGAGTGM